MDNSDLQTEDILQYIPQRPPIVMVDKLVSIHENGGVTSFTIKPGNIFLRDGAFQEAGLIENIAQSAAALTGYKAITEKTNVKRGFIGSVKKLEIEKLPIEKDMLRTTISMVTEVMNATVIEGQVYLGNELIASCMMNIFLEEESNQ